MNEKPQPYLIGHRGWPAAYPENTLAGFQAALEAGAQAVECDIQFSADGVPMVIHDLALRRTVGTAGSVGNFKASELQAMSVHEPKRFPQLAGQHRMATLEQLVRLLGEFPEADLFVEIKDESFINFARTYCVSRCLAEIASLGRRAKIISFDRAAVEMARDEGAETGWVIRRYNDRTHASAKHLQPNYLIADIKKLPSPPEGLWQGPWHWFVYDLVDVPVIEQNLLRGVSCIESWDVGGVVKALAARR